MNKVIKIILISFAILILLFGISYGAYNLLKTKPSNTEPRNQIQEEPDKEENNVTNNNIENEINTTQKNETSEEPKNENTITNTTTNSSSEIIEDTITNKEELAVELVKKEWGNTDGIYIICEGIEADGRYVVSVRNKETTNNLAWYLVDLENKTVQKQ